MPSGDFVQIDDDGAPPTVGDGIFIAGKPYRVIEVRLIADTAVSLPSGWNVFLAEATEVPGSVAQFFTK